MDIMESTIANMSKRFEGVEVEQKVMRKEIDELKLNDKLQDREIQGLSKSLDKIVEDTTWLRRTLTKIVITAIVSGVVTIVTGVIVWAFT
ncbi:hemolysin XhlA family protein, partial [Halalkalibacterium ligniniphilum]|uniref:hemolysin XhlA family protein n=1 Tax=Halalkalibacterium ligniniphilum TaxID=1134413 RepID=UPI001375CC40